MSRVVAYDLPIGYCWHSWDRESLAELRYQADWLESDDYYWNGELDIPDMPAIIREDVANDVVKKKMMKYHVSISKINRIPTPTYLIHHVSGENTGRRVAIYMAPINSGVPHSFLAMVFY